MPSDITGTELLQKIQRRMKEDSSSEGTCLYQSLLADEINRTPPKTQAALLEAMQERRVSSEVKISA